MKMNTVPEDRIKNITNFLLSKQAGNPKIGIILGSGLGDLVNQIDTFVEIPYSEIPDFPISTVKGHSGKFIFGKLNGVETIVLSGRFHYYEGYSMQEVTLPVLILKELGINTLIISNAAGGMNPSFKVGDIMVIKDHINMFGANPLTGKNDDSKGPRFLEMNEAYSKRIIKIAFKVSEKLNIHLQEGVYLGVTGPCYETPSEYRMFHIFGADAVGMSTVPETIIANYKKMEVFAISVITDLGIVGQVEKISHEKVLEAGAQASPKMVELVKAMLPQL